MPVSVVPAEDADMNRLFEIAADAFARNEPVWDSAFPSHWTEAGRNIGAKRMRQVKNSDPYTTYLKAVDDSTGHILGMAKWNIWQNGECTDPSQIQGSSCDYYDTKDDAEFAKQFIFTFLEPRNAAFKRTGGNLASLETLAVDPAYQRQGVGGVLIGWGLEKADSLGLEAVVEASRFGQGLYEKNGFIFQQLVNVKLPGFLDRPAVTFTWMIRPSKSIHSVETQEPTVK